MDISFLRVVNAILENADENIPTKTRRGLFHNVLPMPSPPIAYDVTHPPPDVIIRAEHLEACITQHYITLCSTHYHRMENTSAMTFAWMCF